MRAALPQLPGIVIEALEQQEVTKLSESVSELHLLTGRNESENPAASSVVTEEISMHTRSEATPADVQVPSGKYVSTTSPTDRKSVVEGKREERGGERMHNRKKAK